MYATIDPYLIAPYSQVAGSTGVCVVGGSPVIRVSSENSRVIGTLDVGASYGTLPVLYLKSDIKLSGTGKSNDQFTLIN